MVNRLPQRDRTPRRWPASHAKARESSAPGSLVPLIAILVVAGVALGAVGLGRIPGLPTLGDLLGPWSAPHRSTALGRATPTLISIPSLGVRAETIKVGRAPDGSIATPTADPVRNAGWFEPGPSPGEPGTAVIVGHVDTAHQPAVFNRLAELRKGKLVEVRRADRRTVTFTVDSVERFPKTSFPADRVFAAADKPRLVLVTCGGSWVGGDVGYADNVIVFTTMV